MFRQAQALGRRAAGSLLVLPLFIVVALGALTLAYVAYVLWPRWPVAAVSPEAPTLPIIVAGTSFNIPPGALRVAVQRHAGTQERVDLAFQWPSLAPPDPQARLAGERLFVTIAAAGPTLPPADRVKVIYPRYADGGPQTGADGLASYPFRAGTPYEGEDLLFDAAAPESFAVRCTRDRGPNAPGMCLSDRRIGEAELTMRFPRAWLDQWRAVATGIDRLVTTLRGGEPATTGN